MDGEHRRERQVTSRYRVREGERHGGADGEGTVLKASAECGGASLPCSLSCPYSMLELQQWRCDERGGVDDDWFH
jgi:hypothetical protein